MPKFINYSNRPITIAEGSTSRVIQINQEIESDYPLDILFNLKRTSELPYFNPIVKVDKFLTGENTVDIDIFNTKRIKVIVKQDQDIYINSKANTPPMYIVNGEVLFLTPAKLITKLIFTGAADVIQLKDNSIINN